MRVQVHDIWWEVEFNVCGHYVAASIDGPEENPEIEITSICVEGSEQDIFEVLDSSVVDRIYAAVESEVGY